ncbi:MAG: acyl-CoA dehydrogenase family protein [Nitrososphaeria archaeon]
MDFGETDEHALLRKGMADLVKQFPREYWRQKDVAEEFPQEYWDALAKQGWLGLLVPEEYGGAGLNMYEAHVAAYEAARNGAGVPGGDLLMRTYMFGTYPIRQFGSAGLKEKWLPRIAEGKAIFSIGHTEPVAGVNTFDIETYAEHRAGEYVVNGQKIWMTLAHRADAILLIARTKRKEEVRDRSDGLTLFMLDTHRSKVRTAKLPASVMRPLGENVVYFEDTVIPEEDVIGEVDRGWRYLVNVFNAERLGTASVAAGAGEYVLDLAVDYAKTRNVFGRPIGSNQAVSFPLAEIKMYLEAAKLLLQKAAWRFDRGEDPSVEGNMAAYIAAEAAWRAADQAVQAFGGLGFSVEMDIERYYRDLRLFKTAPVPREMVFNFISRRLLGLPRTF